MLSISLVCFNKNKGKRSLKFFQLNLKRERVGNIITTFYIIYNTLPNCNKNRKPQMFKTYDSLLKWILLMLNKFHSKLAPQYSRTNHCLWCSLAQPHIRLMLFQELHIVLQTIYTSFKSSSPGTKSNLAEFFGGMKEKKPKLGQIYEC